jgi:regulator of protease activity HflC (stomatin/prohibitin superfamily)
MRYFLIQSDQVNQFERGVRFTMGRFSGLVNPGWRVVLPVFQAMRKVDLRLKAVDVPAQDAITKDNVSAKINAVIYYKIIDAGKSVLEVEDVHYAVLQLAQTTIKRRKNGICLDPSIYCREYETSTPPIPSAFHQKRRRR